MLSNAGAERLAHNFDESELNRAPLRLSETLIRMRQEDINRPNDLDTSGFSCISNGIILKLTHQFKNGKS